MPAPKWAATAVGTVGLFFCYLWISRTQPVNADGAGNAIQSWDMLRGNVLLTGWTTTDVPFYTNELLLYVVVEAIYGFRPDVVHVVAALTYTLLVLVTAAVAKGQAVGREAALRVGVALAMVAVPAPGLAAGILLLSPDHTGTSIPLLLTWLVLERYLDRWPRGLPVLVAAMLTVTQVADPLASYVGAVPLAVVSLVRLARRPRRAVDYRLLLAAISSIALTQAALAAVRFAGGFRSHPPEGGLAPLAALPRHARYATEGIAALYGGRLTDRHGLLDTALGVLHLVLLALTVAAVALAVTTMVRTWRRRGRSAPCAGASGRPHAAPTDRVAALAVTGIAINVCAYVVSTLPVDLGTARDLTPVLFLGAVLAGREVGSRLARPPSAHRTGPVPDRRVVPAAPVLLGLLVLLAAELIRHATMPAAPAENHDVAQWLRANGLRHGIGSYWTSHNVTLASRGRVLIAPVVSTSIDGAPRIAGYRSASRLDWYDPTRHHARFLVIDRRNPGHGTESMATSQFGPPERRQDIGTATVLVYRHNLLDGLPAYCVPGSARRMSDCPPHRFPLLD